MTNNKQQTAVEWYNSKIKQLEFWVETRQITWKEYYKEKDKLFEQAKTMRKDEIKNAQMDMFIHLNNLPYGLEYLEKRQSAEDFSQQYYNETF